jgi:hypothetical protein
MMHDESDVGSFDSLQIFDPASIPVHDDTSMVRDVILRLDPQDKAVMSSKQLVQAVRARHPDWRVSQTSSTFHTSGINCIVVTVLQPLLYSQFSKKKTIIPTTHKFIRHHNFTLKVSDTRVKNIILHMRAQGLVASPVPSKRGRQIHHAHKRFASLASANIFYNQVYLKISLAHTEKKYRVVLRGLSITAQH